MQITLETKVLAAVESDALVTYVFEDGEPQGGLAELDHAAAGLLNRLIKGGEVTGKTLEMTLLHAPVGLKAARLLLVGAGKRDAFNSATLRKLGGAALRYLKARSVHGFVFAMRENGANEEAAQALVEGLITADFETDKYKTDKKNDKFIEKVAIAG